MTHHTRKRARVPDKTDNASVVTAHSTSSGGSDTVADPIAKQFNTFLRSHRDYSFKLSKITEDIKLRGTILPEEVAKAFVYTLNMAAESLNAFPQIMNQPYFESATRDLATVLNRLNVFGIKVDASTSTEPSTEPPKPTYASVAAQSDTHTPSPASPSPSSSRTATMGSGSTGHSPKPLVSKARKSARFTGNPPKTLPAYTPQPPKPKSGQQVRLIACIANRPDSSTSDNPRWKAVPTDCFSTFSRDLRSAAPSCTPLSFQLNRKGNLVITFTPTTPRSLLMSNIWVIRGSFELSHDVPILFDTIWSTLHLANVPTRLYESAPVFEQAKILETLRNNSALAALPITLQPRWLRHPSKITGPRSSVVFSFEDPDGAIARQLLKTPTFMFGQPVTVKPWINKPAFIARPRQSVPNPEFDVLTVSDGSSHMDTN
ncbi:hypothetical protein RSOL_407560 [Rhizoctonia solani AG-3 Rhs1AP]|uniref:Uncharacterized protein n=1 Tax=Rhizoctonia solani AG-3 Rhs1AP TaxID=1086054 RepID=X8JDK8_9AGAM|nr:hypothetical protein RSOL_407560 [Rhizoctonia solani AG-3 Rhs1AP]